MGFTHRQLKEVAHLPDDVRDVIVRNGIDPLLVLVIKQPDQSAPNNNDAFDGILWGGKYENPVKPGEWLQLKMIPVDLTSNIRVPPSPDPTDIKIEPQYGECVRLLLPGNTAAIHVRVGRWFWA